MAPWLLWLSGLSASAAIAAALLPAWIPVIVVGTALASTGVMAGFLWGVKRLNP